MKPYILVHILYVFVSLSEKGMLGAGLGDVWELNSMIFKGCFQPRPFYDCMLVMLSFVGSVQVGGVGVSQAPGRLLGQIVT